MWALAEIFVTLNDRSASRRTDRLEIHGLGINNKLKLFVDTTSVSTPEFCKCSPTGFFRKLITELGLNDKLTVCFALPSLCGGICQGCSEQFSREEKFWSKRGEEVPKHLGALGMNPLRSLRLCCACLPAEPALCRSRQHPQPRLTAALPPGVGGSTPGLPAPHPQQLWSPRQESNPSPSGGGGLLPGRRITERRPQKQRAACAALCFVFRATPSGTYSTVTLLARLRGLSTSVPRTSAAWYARSCSGTTCRMGESAP